MKKVLLPQGLDSPLHNFDHLHFLIHIIFSQAVAGLMKPMVEAHNIPQFLWDHIEADLDNLRRILGCSIDDVFILIHSIINNMMITHNPGNICRSIISYDEDPQPRYYL